MAGLGIKVRFEGAKELRRALRRLPEEISRRALKKGALAAAEVIRAEAARRAPRRTGALGRGILKQVDRKARDEVRVGIGWSKDVFYGQFVEFGHSIVPPGKTARKGGAVGNVPAKPFLRPAMDEKADEAVRAGAAVLRREVERAWDRTVKR